MRPAATRLRSAPGSVAKARPSEVGKSAAFTALVEAHPRARATAPTDMASIRTRQFLSAERCERFKDYFSQFQQGIFRWPLTGMHEMIRRPVPNRLRPVLAARAARLAVR